jgi:ABC-type lipoprotein export system ATPase subunit/ABC-type antimicrobial peptide transport system permease subunit
MIKLINLSRTYKIKRAPSVKALKKVNLTLGEKGLVFIVGKSGCGKSTLLNIIGGLDRHDEGELLIQGKSTKNFSNQDYDSYRNTMVGFVFQEYNLIDDFSVGENIALALELQGQKATSERINEILNLVELGGLENRRTNELSGGQKQRVAIARALVKNPHIILADEPTGALDSKTGTQVLKTLRRLANDRLVIVVSHDEEFALSYADRIIELVDGELSRDISRKDNEEIKAMSITFENDMIHVPANYELTKEDMDRINLYIKTHEDTPLKLLKEQMSAFKDTKKEDIVESKEEYKPIKSKMPFKASLKMGASALKHKRVRLAISIILAALAFTFFGSADTIGSYKNMKMALTSLHNSDVNYLSFNASYKIENEYDPEYYSYLEFNMDDNQIAFLNGVDEDITFKPVITTKSNYPWQRRSYYGPSIYLESSSGLLKLDQSLLDETNFTFIGTAPTLPLAYNEIVLTEYTYQIFHKNDFLTPEGTNIKINRPEDLIGKEMLLDDETFRIKGILDTKCNLTPYLKLEDDEQGALQYLFLSTQFDLFINSSYHNLLYVSSDFYNSRNYTSFDGNVDFYSYISNATYSTYTGYYDIRENLVNEAHYLKNKSKDSLLSNDVFIETMTFMQLVPNYYNSFSETELVNFLYERYTPDEVRDYLIFYVHDGDESKIPPTSSWDEEDKKTYGLDFIALMDDYEKTYFFSPLLNSEAVSSINSFGAKITYGSYGYYYDESESNLKEVNIVGVYQAKRGRNDRPATAVSNELAATMGLKQSGAYGFAIASFDSSDYSKVKKFVDLHYTSGKLYAYRMSNTIINAVDMFDFMLKPIGVVFTVVGVIFAIFSSLLMLNFISNSVILKKRQIGVLRALGARGTDVIGIFANEALIIALINFVLAIIGTGIISGIINSKLKVELAVAIRFMNFGIRQIALLLLISCFVAFISSALPVLKIARKKPIDAINDK